MEDWTFRWCFLPQEPNIFADRYAPSLYNRSSDKGNATPAESIRK
jgi:hypothetical protein